MSLTNGNAHRTKKDMKKAAKAREAAWQDVVAALHDILDLVLAEKREFIEAAHLNGWRHTVHVHGAPPEGTVPVTLDPDQPTPDSAPPQPAPLIVLP